MIISERFDPFAPGANRSEALLHIGRYRYAADIIKRTSNHVGNQTVLDIACGYGWGSRLIHKTTGLNVVGVDHDTKTINTARRKYNRPPAVSFKKGTITAIPSRKGSFDYIICLETLEHLVLQDAQRAILEFYRILKPGGILVASGPNPFFTSVMKRLISHYNNPFHLNELSAEKLQKQLISAGFEFTSAAGQYLFFPLFYLLGIFLQPTNFFPPSLCRYYALVVRKPQRIARKKR